MRRAPITSTMMLSAGYDESTSVLEIEFLSGAIYQYLDVSPDDYDQLLRASSKGRFFLSRIRKLYVHRRI